MLRLLPTSVLFLALSSPLVAAPDSRALQANTPQENSAGEATDQSAELAKDRERVLTLTSGTHLRTRAKFEDGRWQLLQGGTWLSLPPGSVAEAHTVKDLKREAKKLERSLKLSSPDQRAELAFWLAEHGLFNEALEHLDINLREDPDHQPSLAILQRGLVPVRLDAYLPESAPDPDADDKAWLKTTRDLFDQLGKLSPATREVAWSEVRPLFADPESSSRFLRTATQILQDHSSARRKTAAQALQRVGLASLKESAPEGQAAIKSLVQRAALDATGSVRNAAARTLRDLEEPSVTAPLVKALSSRSSAVRANSADALGVIGQPAVAPAIVAALAATNASSGSASRPPASNLFVGRQLAYIQDFDVEAFSGAVAADPQINVLTEGVVLDVRVLSVSQRQARTHERSAMRGALGSLLGQDFRYDTDKWSAWIAAHPVAE